MPKTKTKSTLKKKKTTTKRPSKRKKSGEILIGKWQGRMGNRMHQYAYGATYSEKFNLNFKLPSKWEGDELFVGCGHTIVEDDDLRLKINQTVPEFDNEDYKKLAFEEYFKKK